MSNIFSIVRGSIPFWLLIIALMLFSSQLDAQQRSFGTLPLVDAGEVKVNQQGNLNDTPEYKHLLKIYNNLIEARGDLRYRVPTLFFKDVEGHVAYIDYNTFDIIMEKKAYEVCMKYGDEAVAFLLGHELTHYYEKHAWRSAFAQENGDLKIGKTLRNINDEIANETEADYLGGLLSYSAGYGLFDKGDAIIRDLYKAYNLKDTLAGYPELNDRIELAKRSAEKLRTLVDVFDMSNYLLCTGNYEQSLSYYNYILNYYQSRELYNNVGVAAVMHAMELFGEKEIEFKYVTTLDVNFKGSKDIGSGNEQIDLLLNESILHFNAATTLDPGYAVAYLNKANAYALLKDWKKAEFYLVEEALPAAQKDSLKYAKTLTDITVLEGIILAKTGNKDAAEEKFKSAKEKGNALAAYNLNILNEVKVETTAAIPNTTFDNIDDSNLDDFYDELNVDDKKIVKLSDKLTFFQNNPDHGKCRFFLSLEDEENKYTAFMFTTKASDGSTNKNIKLGDKVEDLKKAYGDPQNIIETSLGQYWNYDKKLFLIENNLIKKWINYDTRIFDF